MIHQSDHKQEIRLILWRPFCFSILNPLPAKFSPEDSKNEFGIPELSKNNSQITYAGPFLDIGT